MDVNELLKEKREAILQIAARHGARNVRVFGSAARAEADEQSDILHRRRKGFGNDRVIQLLIPIPTRRHYQEDARRQGAEIDAPLC
jgi:hypothetical protein